MHSILKDKNDIKIFILYLLRQIAHPLQYSDINDIVVQDEYVNYFDFVDCFADLLETRNIEEIKENDRILYKITEQGAMVADSLESSILQTIRDKSLKDAMKLLSFKEKNIDLKCSGEQRDDGKYDFNCKVIASGEEILNVNLILSDITQFEKMKENFYDKPEIIYKGILALLSGDVNYILQ